MLYLLVISKRGGKVRVCMFFLSSSLTSIIKMYDNMVFINDITNIVA